MLSDFLSELERELGLPSRPQFSIPVRQDAVVSVIRQMMSARHNNCPTCFIPLHTFTDGSRACMNETCEKYGKDIKE